MNIFEEKHREFWQELSETKTREELLEIISIQNPELTSHINRIEWVFKNKLTHLTWEDGTPITERPLTNYELALLVDPIFDVDRDLLEMGLSPTQQRELFTYADSVMWARTVLKVEPRAYQILMLRHPNRFKILRAGRRLGKTYTMAIELMHYSFLNKNGRAIVITPMLAQATLIFDAIAELAEGSDVVEKTIVRNKKSPPAEYTFTNGSTIRFFTSGTKSGGKSAATRGQEAHLIILDELDYMADDDLDAILAMMQKTSENQAEKQLIGASTPTGKKGIFWEWATGKSARVKDSWKTEEEQKKERNTRFKEFWFPSFCFPAGELVTMADGSFRQIEDIKVGDLVWTEEGPNRVLRTFERDYEGDLVNLKTFGNGRAIRATPEHPFMACDRTRKQSPSYGGVHDGCDWNWVEAGDLKQAGRRDQNSGSWIQYVYPTGIGHKDISVVDLHESFEKNGDLVSINRIFKTGRRFANTMPDRVELNGDLATLLGWYLAEGSLGGYNKHYGFYTIVEWTLSADERGVVEELQKALDSFGGGQLKIVERPDHNAIKVYVYNAPLAVLCEYMCGRNSSEKALSEEVVFAPLEFQEKLLESYAQGDGWQHNSGSDMRTTSPVLARQVRDITARLGWIASISVHETEEARAINPNYGTYETKPSWCVGYSSEGRSMLGKRVLTEGVGAFLVRSTTRENFEGKVYNFEVENTNSYCIDGLLVHNCNPHFDKETEDFLRAQHSEMVFRHEVEADWGEDAQGVYPRRHVDSSFAVDDWEYDCKPVAYDEPAFLVMGVDWDKYGAGTNIVILKVYEKNHPDEELAGRIRCYYREEVPSSEYTFTKATQRIIELNEQLDPRHIYVDRGSGEVQVEMLMLHGKSNPLSKLTEKLKGIQFGENIEVMDPLTRDLIKKPVKPYMVDNLRMYLERGQIEFPTRDEELYMQLISYVVARENDSGRPVFEMNSSSVGDHAHDGLILACLAITENYGDLYSLTVDFSTIKFISDRFGVESKTMEEIVEDKEDGKEPLAPMLMKRSFTRSSGRSSGARRIKRSMF